MERPSTFFIGDNVTIEKLNISINHVSTIKIGEQSTSVETTASASESSLSREPTEEHSDYTEYRKLADGIQKDIYEGKSLGPRSDCLQECRERISQNLKTEYYNIFFGISEGHADKLRTTSDLTEGLADHDIYKCLELFVPHTSFPKLARITYLFRHAAALAVSGNVELAKKEADEGYKALRPYLEAERHAKTITSCLYGRVNVYLGWFSAMAAKGQTSRQSMKDNIFPLINEGLDYVEKIKDSNSENKHRWIRMFLVKRAFVYLNIGLLGEDIYDTEELHITESDRTEAKKCLDDVKTHYWKTEESRRLMLYNRAEAKLLWIEGYKQEGIEILSAALEIAAGFKREKSIYQPILTKWNKEIGYKRLKSK
ncbi:uncharacterized protein [Argopecten irradians]|uniref:uncharacterized protein n=1 Tax=Argopecten irradians TaxID=31199 RepID=UPI003722818A